MRLNKSALLILILSCLSACQPELQPPSGNTTAKISEVKPEEADQAAKQAPKDLQVPANIMAADVPVLIPPTANSLVVDPLLAPPALGAAPFFYGPIVWPTYVLINDEYFPLSDNGAEREPSNNGSGSTIRLGSGGSPLGGIFDCTSTSCDNACRPFGATCTLGKCYCTGATKCGLIPFTDNCNDTPNFGYCCANTCIAPNTYNSDACCGTSNEVCGSGQDCVTNPAPAKCVCNNGDTICAGQCVDLETDNNNCGFCGNICTGGSTCNGLECVCPNNQAFCGASNSICCNIPSNNPSGNCCEINGNIPSCKTTSECK